MSEESALHGVDDVLAYIDKTVSNVEGEKWLWASREVNELLKDIRDGLTSAPEWSQVVESNLSAELERMKRSRRFWINRARAFRGERNRARSLAVLLEQALNVAEGLVPRLPSQILAAQRDAAESEATDKALVARLATAAHVAYPGPDDTDAGFMQIAADHLEGHYEVGGSNLRAAVVRVLRVVAESIEARS